MEARWLSVEEISQHLGIKKDTVYKWVRNRNMPSHKVGRLIKFQVKEVDQWIREVKAATDIAGIGKAFFIGRGLPEIFGGSSMATRLYLSAMTSS